MSSAKNRKSLAGDQSRFENWSGIILSIVKEKENSCPYGGTMDLS